MTETTTTRAKHSPEEIKQNHLNAAERSLLAAAKRVAKVTEKRNKVKAEVGTVDSEHAAAVSLHAGARERYRHAHLIANGGEPEAWPDAEIIGTETDPHDVPDEDTDDPADDDQF